jgi:hypothetical protein
LDFLTDFTPVHLTTFMHPNLTDLHHPKTQNLTKSLTKNNLTVRTLTREIHSGITVLLYNTARTTLLIVARAEMLVLKTASAHQFFSRRKGGKK